jgi:VWFA-related protein
MVGCSISHRTRWIAVFALGATCSLILAQEPSPTSKLNNRLLLQQMAQSSSEHDNSPVTTIRAYSNIVVVDVIVTDSQGNPVRGLKKSDFTLLESKQPQAIRTLEEHGASANERFTPEPALPPGLFSNKAPAPTSGPVNVLLLDYLNTPLSAQPYARKQLLHFLDEAPAGVPIAIFALTNRLMMLHGFTSDFSVLKAALDPKDGGAPQASNVLTDPLNGGNMRDTTLSTAYSEAASFSDAAAAIITPEIVANISRFESMQASFQEDMRVRYTLDGLELLARYLVGIPGHKNVIWYTAGFPLRIEPDVSEADSGGDPNDSTVQNDEELRKTDNLLTRAQVAVYPVDARGLMTDPSLNFASNDSPSTAPGDFLQRTAQERLTMEAMAEDTGGRAFYNTNNLSQAVEKSVEFGSNYYTLTYSPSNIKWDARFRSIKLAVDQPKVSLTYRNGYYAVDPNDHRKFIASLAATSAPTPRAMVTAMMHGGPNPAEILFKERIRPATSPLSDAPLKTNQTNPDPKVNIKGPFREYGIDLVPDATAFTCQQDEAGNYHCAVEVWTFVYNSDGEKLITASNRLFRRLSPDDYKKMLTGGMAFHQAISVPAKGNYYIRTAVHDMVSDRVGAVEVPVTAVAALEPLKPLSSAPDFTPTTLPASEPGSSGVPPAK